MTGFELPHDTVLEIVVLGCAVATRHGYHLAAILLVDDDFYVRAHRRIWRACSTAPHVDEAARIDHVAARSHVRRDHLERAVRERPVMWGCAKGLVDVPGERIIRLAELGARRRRLHELGAESRRLLEAR